MAPAPPPPPPAWRRPRNSTSDNCISRNRLRQHRPGPYIRRDCDRPDNPASSAGLLPAPPGRDTCAEHRRLRATGQVELGLPAPPGSASRGRKPGPPSASEKVCLDHLQTCSARPDIISNRLRTLPREYESKLHCDNSSCLVQPGIAHYTRAARFSRAPIAVPPARRRPRHKDARQR